jgi:hypothetical protein
MMALLQRMIVATGMLAALLAGCSAGPIGDTLPQSMGGLPEGAPARPNVTNRQFPAIHDMPAPRSTQPMSEEEQVKMEKDLQAIRDRQNAAAKDEATPPAPAPAAKTAAAKTAAKPAVKKQSDAKTSGAKPNP